jgi:hypothetical protein
MKTYQIFLANGETWRVRGAIMVVNKKTGQSIIYSLYEVVNTNIVAVIPSSALVAVVS